MACADALLLFLPGCRMYYKSEEADITGALLEANWKSFHRNLERFLLFLVVVLYFPAAHVILAAFADSHDLAVLNVYGCGFVDNEGNQCCMRALPWQQCFNSPGFSMPTVFQVRLCVVVI